MNFRFAKRSDISRIVELHYDVRDFYSVGFFSKTRKSFLRAYYKILIDDPNEIIFCAVENDEIKGFCSGSLDVQKQQQLFKKKKLVMAASLLPTIVMNPTILTDIYKRYISLNNQDSKDSYISSSGARSEYWTWSRHDNNSEYSVELLNRFYHIFYLCGEKNVFFEVDEINKKILKLHKINGATIENEFILPDGRKRIIMKYNLTKKYNNGN